jgi:hypothetical protein
MIFTIGFLMFAFGVFVVLALDLHTIPPEETSRRMRRGDWFAVVFCGGGVCLMVGSLLELCWTNLP